MNSNINLNSYNFFEIRKDSCYKIILHDCIIDFVYSDDEGVYFHFPDGFNLLLNNGIKNTGEAIVFLEACNIGDIDFKYMRRFSFLHHYYEFSTLIESNKINQWKLELIDEFYTFNQLYWKLAIRSSKSRLESELEITASEFKSIKYYWK